MMHADRFVVVTHALEERRTPGNTLIVQPDQPWQVCQASRQELCGHTFVVIV